MTGDLSAVPVVRLADVQQVRAADIEPGAILARGMVSHVSIAEEGPLRVHIWLFGDGDLTLAEPDEIVTVLARADAALLRRIRKVDRR